MVSPEYGLAVMGLPKHHDDYRIHFKRFVDRLPINKLAWVNLTRNTVKLQLIRN